MRFTLPFSEIGKGDLSRVGGKGANLGALAGAGIPVPPGFCVTTEAFDRFVAALPGADVCIAALEVLDGRDVPAARAAAGGMRSALEGVALPAEIAVDVVAAWRALGEEHPLAVRSSATAEDLPGASFAGQQDTYLNVRGEAALLDAVRRCWISLFTDRAVLYRARGGFGHRKVKLAVVVQRLVDPEVSGILFTADPVSQSRQVVAIDAGFGLGEALVNGLISADQYRVDRRSEKVIEVRPGDKAFAIRSASGGGTVREPLSDAQRHARALADAQVMALARIGARVEALYDGVPQDIEWCIARERIYVVQARPITSLYPLPPVSAADASMHVFLSFSHMQMMLDPMPRLALEAWRYFFPAGKSGDGAEMSAALLPVGSRLYLDITDLLRLPRARRLLLSALSVAYERAGQSAAALAERPEFRAGHAAPAAVIAGARRVLGPIIARLPRALLWADPREGAAAFTRALEEVPRACVLRIASAGTPGDRIRQCTRELDGLFARVRSHLPNVIAGILAQRLLLRVARDPVDADLLLRGLPGNVTTEMDLAVGDLTDLLRPHPELAAVVRDRPWPAARVGMAKMPGGPALLAGVDRFLQRYGNRGAGEIDLSRPRWRDDPALLLQVMLGGLGSVPGAHRRHHQAQVAEGEAAAARLVASAPRLLRARVRRATEVARFGLGLREHPKWIIVQILAAIRDEVLAAGATLAARGQIAGALDVWHLSFEELAGALDDAGCELDAVVAERKAGFAADRARKPPLAMSSDGEIPTLDVARADFPEGALSGTAASSGVVEGLARVITDPQRESVLAGEILVAPFTDPGWTPLFVHAAGVVTEVGGLMTHGAVVAREYGIPAVVSVSSALECIKTGQRIRVDGTRGFVEILGPVEPARPIGRADLRPAKDGA